MIFAKLIYDVVGNNDMVLQHFSVSLKYSYNEYFGENNGE